MSPESPSDDVERDSSLLAQRALDDLEWSDLLEQLAGRCISELGRKKVLALAPAATQQDSAARLELVAEVLDLLAAGVRLPTIEATDVTLVVERARRRAVASAPELIEVRSLLRSAHTLGRFVTEHADRAPVLSEVLSFDPELRPLREALEHALEEGDGVADRASSELEKARRRVDQLRSEMKSRLARVIQKYRDALQDGYYAERDGRYVLPVRTDAPYRVEGIVLDSSASGSTLYVEPREVAELGNRLKMAQAEAQHEEARVLAALSDQLGQVADATLDARDACARGDALRAIGEYAQATRSRVLEFDELGSVHLRAMRHPVMATTLDEVVPNDLELGAGRGLVLSGPNAGGKTVALKCLGLAALLQATGLPVPAEPGSKVGFFHSVFADIGDDQSLARSLSTFSGHIECVRELLERSERGVLVLLDELAGGTDPEEGASLAVAVLEELVRRGAAVAVTTHYERLKELGQESPVIDNAAVGFDFERLEPTFRLTLGVPGASSALEVAKRHGLPQTVIDQARRLLPEISTRREDILRELERERIELREMRSELERERERQEQLGRQIEAARERALERERKGLSREGQELSQAVRDARAELQRVRASLKDVSSAATLRDAERTIDRAAHHVAIDSPLQQKVRQAPPTKTSSAEELAPGVSVRVAGLDALAEVLEKPSKGQVRVQVGGLKMSVPLGRVTVVAGRPVKQPSGAKRSRFPARTAVESPLEVVATSPPRTEDVTLDLRGQRVEESLEQVDVFLDQLMRRGEPAGFVLHGHGTGALKAAVRDYLSGHSLARASRSAERGEGGDAFTIVWLRDS